MNYIYPITDIELGIVSLSASILLIAILIHLYIYLKLEEKSQLYILYINLVALCYAIINTVLFSLVLMDADINIILRLSSVAQVIISYTSLVWIIYIEEALTLNKKIKSILSMVKIVVISLLIFITIVSFTIPSLFVSVEKSISTALEGIRQVDVMRGEIGVLYVIRDIHIIIVAILIFFDFLYEIIVNKKRKYNTLFMIGFLLFIAGGTDEIFSVYRGSNLIFENIRFPLSILSSAILAFITLYLSVEKFMNATFIIHKTKNILTDISKQHNNIFSSAVSMSSNIVNIKHSIKGVISNFHSISSSILREIYLLKSSIVKSIEYSKEFEVSCNSQKNDINTNVIQLEKIENNFPNMETVIGRQKEGIIKASDYLEKSIATMYDLQSRAKDLTEYSLVFKNKTTETKDKIHASANQIESFLQISTQIRRIIIFINNMYDKTKILAINSGIQASKSGDWTENFSIVSKEISELVKEILAVTEKLEKLLSNIDTTFKDFYFTKDDILSSFNILVGDTDIIENDIKKVSEDIYLQNDYNTHSLKNIHKLLSMNKNMGELLVEEKYFCKTTENMLLHLDEILTNMKDKSVDQTDALRSLLSDMNKILATSNDLKSTCSEFSDNLESFDSVVINLKNKTLEYN